MRLRQKIAVPILSVLLGASLIWGFIFSYVLQHSIQEEVVDKLYTISNLKSNTIKYFFENIKINLRQEVGDPEYIDVLENKEINYQRLHNELEEFLGRNEIFHDALIINTDGEIVYAFHHPEYSSKPLDEKYLSGTFALMENEFHFNDFFFSRESYKNKNHEMEEDNLLLLVATPFTIEGEFKGAFVVEVHIKKIGKVLMDGYGLGKTGESYFIGRDYSIRSASRFDPKGERVLKETAYSKNAEKCFSGEKISKEESIYTDEKGTKVIGVHSYFPDTDWCLVSEIDADEAFSVLQNLKILLLILTCTSVLILMIFISWLSHRITLPLSTLKKTVQHMADGDLSVRVTLQSNDELEILGTTFNRMAESLEQSQKKIEAKVMSQTQKLRKQKERFEALAEDLKKFKLAVETASDQIIITNPDGVILYANKAVEDITGFSRKETIGNRISSKGLGGGMMDQKFYSQLWYVISEEKKPFIGEITNRNKKGQEYTSQVRISPILGEDGNILFFVAIRHDVTKERENERLKNEFIDIASHELRTPMTLIKGYASMILEEFGSEIPEIAQKQLTTILKNSERLIAMVNDMLDISKIESGTMDTLKQQESIDLLDLFQELQNDFSPLLKEKKVNLNLLFSEKDVRPKAIFNYNALKRVFTNIIGNALKFVPEGKGRIDVRLRKKNKQWYEIAIIDNGPGIRAEDQKKIFQKFGMVGTPLNHTTGGTGLGLSISKNIIEHGGGSLWVESAEGQGASFLFTIPREK